MSHRISVWVAMVAVLIASSLGSAIVPGSAEAVAAGVAAVRAAAVCPGSDGGTGYGTAPGVISGLGVGGTTSADLAAFGAGFNAIRISNCLAPLPPANFRYDVCLQTRLFWIAEDPSLDPRSAWGHTGTPRSDGAATIGCDGNLAGGNGYTGASVAQSWWDSPTHRTSLYRPASTANPAGICVGFAMTHGGVPNEPVSFVRAAAVRFSC